MGKGVIVPKIGDLIVVAHWSNFDMADGSVRVGSFEKYEQGYWYIKESMRGYRYARAVSNKNIRG